MSEIVNTYRYVQINAHTQTYTDIVHPDTYRYTYANKINFVVYTDDEFIVHRRTVNIIINILCFALNASSTYTVHIHTHTSCMYI